MKKNLNLSKSECLSQSWKERLEYTDGLYGTPFHNSWRSICFSIKGKRIGVSDRWKKFKNFKEDMHPYYREGMRICRTDKTESFSKENCKWVVPGALSEYALTNIAYKGETKSIKEWCLQYDLSYNGVRQRYFKGKNYTSEEILFGKKKAKKKELLEQSQLNHKALRAKASKMISSYKCRDKKRNFQPYVLEIEWFIENILRSACSYCLSTRNLGADRLENSKPHTPDNIIACCYRRNVVRKDHFTYERMKKIGDFLRENID